MKKLLIILSLISIIYAKQYSIIVFSTKKYNKQVVQQFIKKFPNGIIKQYSKFIEYKIEPFQSYNDAKKYLFKVQKYYKYPLIVKYNPNLGKILYTNTSNTKKANITYKKNKYAYCTNECGCEQNNTQYSWEINKTKILTNLNINIKKYFFIKNETNNTNIQTNTQKRNNNDINTNISNKCNIPNISNYRFYFDIYGNIYQGQKDISSLNGNDENIKLGIMYTKYFFNKWKFFTDDRIIFSRNQVNSHTSHDLYLDINELYIRNYCSYNNMFNILIGRKKTKDYKSWWYNAPLDEIQLFNEDNLLTYQLILATRLNNETVTDSNSQKAKLKNSHFFIFHVNYEYYYNKNISGYYIYENSKPSSKINRKISFIGAALNSKENNKLYWINIGLNNGNIYDNDYKTQKNGFGFDIGARIPYSNRLSLAGSFAYSSKNFTQPYIATNYSDYLLKSFSLRYYGNVLDPILENLNILSIYGIYTFDQFSSLITSLHNYTQNTATKTQYNSKYFYSTNGTNKNLGNEFDLVYQHLKNKYEKIKIGGGIFLGGKAYDYLKNKNAYRIFVNYRYYWK